MFYKKKYIAGVSAGSDSMFMLHKYFRKIAIVCHVNYHDREDTNNDERIVRNFCLKKKIPIIVFDVNNNNLEEVFKKNLQSKYREIRFDFFEKNSKDININKIMIGHNLDDNIETMYMQLFKKKNPLFYGLEIRSKYNDLIIFRPLLNLSKSNIYLKCLQKNIDFAFDYSNENLKFQRNYVRHILEHSTTKEKLMFKNSIDKYNKNNKKTKKIIMAIYNSWKISDFNISYFVSINNIHKNKILYVLLSELKIKKINNNKLKELNKFIEFGKINSSYRIQSNIYVFKGKSIIKITYNNL